jgi:hypothetical protein
MSEFTPQSDLSLQAFRYAAGELNSAEGAAFERLLETDLAAQLALVRAVQLATVLQSATPPIQSAIRMLPSERRSPSRRWSSLLALFCSGVVAATLLVALREESTPVGPENATVSLWSELHEEDVVEPAPLDDAALPFDGDASEEDLVPDWMLAAVAIDDQVDGGNDAGTVPGDGAQAIDDET